MIDLSSDAGLILRILGMFAIFTLLVSVRLADFYYPARSRWIRWVARAQEVFTATVGAALAVNVFSTLPPTPGLWVLVLLGLPSALVAAVAAGFIVANRH